MEILSCCCFTPPPSDAVYKCQKKNPTPNQLVHIFSPLLLESGNNTKDDRAVECYGHGEYVCF